MANELYDVAIQLTTTGAKVELDKLYVYPDGHANLVFRDGRNWPLNDQYEVIEAVARLMRRLEKAAKNRRV
jgi:hypothetical protein